MEKIMQFPKSEPTNSFFGQRVSMEYNQASIVNQADSGLRGASSFGQCGCKNLVRTMPMLAP